MIDVGAPTRRAIRIAQALALLAAVLPCPASEAAEAAKPARPAGLSVSVKPSRRMCFEDLVNVTGTIVAHQEVEIGPNREGYQITQVLVEPLDEVSPGQVLARLAAPDGQGGTTTGSVRSSVTGTVGQIWAVTGSPATIRQPLFRIVVGGALDLEAQLPSADLAKLSIGQPVTVTPLGLPELSGTVQSIGTALDPASQLGRIRIGIRDARDLRIGTFARGVIVVGRRCGIGVPYSSVSYAEDGTIVNVVVGDRVETRQVTIGLLSGKDVEIRSGLGATDVVVTRAGPFLRDGEQINPIVTQER